LKHAKKNNEENAIKVLDKICERNMTISRTRN